MVILVHMVYRNIQWYINGLLVYGMMVSMPLHKSKPRSVQEWRWSQRWTEINWSCMGERRAMQWKRKKSAVRVYESKENRGNFYSHETYTSEDIFEVFFCIWCGSLVGYNLCEDVVGIWSMVYLRGCGNLIHGFVFKEKGFLLKFLCS